MPRTALLAVVCVLVVCISAPGDAKICGSMRIQNNGEGFDMLNNCTVIAGYLKLVLMETMPAESWAKITFPKLTEIWDYLLVFRVHGLPSLGPLFPNLRVIRGLATIENHALVLFSLRGLREIGLTSLRRIERGLVYVGNCPKLCFFDKINWQKLGTNITVSNQTNHMCNDCAPKCKGYCWSENVCQSSEVIQTCNNFRDDEECVDKCPSDKVILQPGNECITVEECEQIDTKRQWFAYEGNCINKCPKEYQAKDKKCVYCGDRCICTPKAIVSTLETVKYFEGCTHINGSLRFTVKEDKVAEELETHMSDIREIWGYLQVTRSSAITSFDFLKNLTLIRGDVLDNNNNSLIVKDNQNLNKMWNMDENFQLKIKRGQFLFHNNPQLCYKDIEKLNNLTVNLVFSPVQVSQESNGDQRFCEELLLNTAQSIIHPTNATLQWQNMFPHKNVSYFVYYIENDSIDEVTQDVCKSDFWNVVASVDNTQAFLPDLKPFTNYSFYIVVNIINGHSRQKTKIQHFTTLSDDPSEPRNVEVHSFNSTAVNFTWLAPSDLRGVLQKYVITYYKIMDDEEALATRNYCRHPLSEDYNGIPIREKVPGDGVDRKGVTKADGNCNCEPAYNPKRALEDFRTPARASPEAKFKENFMSMVVNGPYQNTACYLQCETCNQTCDSLYYIAENDKFRYNQESRLATENTNQSNVFQEHVVGPKENSTFIINLDYFSKYVFYMSACNVNRTARQQCSEVVMVYNRTRRSPGADNLTDFVVFETKKGVVLNWTNPVRPNSMILSYTIEWKEESTTITQECLPPSVVKSAGYELNLHAGSYLFRVRANTLAGAGEFTTFQRCIVGSQYNPIDYGLVIGLSCVLVVIIACGAYAYYRYRKRKLFDLNNRLIQSINPDYCGGATYVEDEWEVDREQVEIGNSLGKGTFGIVYSGYLKDRQMPCAIKTINSNSTREERYEFLNEASVMKSFSNAHHVVRLLGVTSRGPSPLVIMELMACGDLKNFLRKSRDSSQTIGCNEMYRMAIEIADGMAYLAAKKFTHRDLAARNCMVAGDHTIKIGDFGMARDIYETDYYRKDSQGLLPVRWMAPESLADGVFTSDSDVWSYGVVLWEMVTLAEQPYQGLGSQQVLQFVIARGRLDRPPECPDLLYEIMDACWKWHPNKRPLFTDIVAKLERHVSEDFKVMSFFHSREGNEYRLNGKERPYNPPAMAQNTRHSKPGYAHYHKSDENIDLFNDDRDPMAYPSNPNHRQNLLADYAHEEDNAAMPGSNGYKSLSKSTT